MASMEYIFCTLSMQCQRDCIIEQAEIPPSVDELSMLYLITKITATLCPQTPIREQQEGHGLKWHYA